jgi:hypothetical protein
MGLVSAACCKELGDVADLIGRRELSRLPFVRRLFCLSKYSAAMGASVYRDTQVVEIVGRNWLVNTLFDAGIEVARPERDRGVDLIAYVDREPNGFRAIPIQLKSSTTAAFSIDQKYAKMPELLLCFVWHLGDSEQEPKCFALNYGEALQAGDKLGWTSSASWTEGQKYSANKPSAKVLEALKPYEMASPTDWQRRFAVVVIDPGK